MATLVGDLRKDNLIIFIFILGKTVTLYRLGDHVDISRGPMVGDSSFMGRRCTIASVSSLKDEETFK